MLHQPHILVDNILYRNLLSAGKGISLLKVNVEKMKYMQDLMFSQWSLWILSSGIHHSVLRWKSIKFSERICRLYLQDKAEKAKRGTSMKPWLLSTLYWYPTWLISRPWEWRRHVLPKRLLIFKELRAWRYISEDRKLFKNYTFKICKIVFFGRFILVGLIQMQIGGPTASMDVSMYSLATSSDFFVALLHFTTTSSDNTLCYVTFINEAAVLNNLRNE
jgi:hypothetical protein